MFINNEHQILQYMRRLEVINAPRVAYIFQLEIERSDESRYDHRLHGVLLVAQGLSCSKVADLLGHTTKTIENWVNNFNSDGFAALRDEKRTGRPSKITANLLEQINDEIRLDPHDLGYNQNLWDGKLLSHHIKIKYGISISVRQCQRLFHKLDFRRRIPRPISSKSDPTKQEAFKKT